MDSTANTALDGIAITTAAPSPHAADAAGAGKGTGAGTGTGTSAPVSTSTAEQALARPGPGTFGRDVYLSVIPEDPDWQPDPLAGGLALGALRRLTPRALDHDAQWHPAVEAVDAGRDVDRIGCPRCAAALDRSWWRRQVAEKVGQAGPGAGELTVAVPCCGAALSLNDLDYSPPCGFARFELAACGPGRGGFDEAELAQIAAALGHPVRQVLARW